MSTFSILCPGLCILGTHLANSLFTCKISLKMFNYGSFFWVRFRTFWMTLVYIYIYIYIYIFFFFFTWLCRCNLYLVILSVFLWSFTARSFVFSIVWFVAFSLFEMALSSVVSWEQCVLFLSFVSIIKMAKNSDTTSRNIYFVFFFFDFSASFTLQSFSRKVFVKRSMLVHICIYIFTY